MNNQVLKLYPDENQDRCLVGRKPNIVDVVSKRVDLRRHGANHFGLCPFHAERGASFTVSEAKEFYHCFGCGEHGDVIDFIQKIDGLSFREACASLGMGTGGSNRPRPKPLTRSRRAAGELAIAWANEQHTKLNSIIAERYEQRDLADEIADVDLAEILDRELVMLRGFYDSLAYPAGVAELLAVRKSIEAITSGVEMAL